MDNLDRDRIIRFFSFVLPKLRKYEFLRIVKYLTNEELLKYYYIIKIEYIKKFKLEDFGDDFIWK